VDSQLTLSGPVFQSGSGPEISGGVATCQGTKASFVSSVGAAYSISLTGVLGPVGPAPVPDGPSPAPAPAPPGPSSGPTSVGGGPIMEEVDWSLPNPLTSASSYALASASFVPERPFLATTGANFVHGQVGFLWGARRRHEPRGRGQVLRRHRG